MAQDLPLNDKEIKRVAGFIHQLYDWVRAPEGDTDAIEGLKNRYKRVSGLLARGNIDPEITLFNMNSDKPLKEFCALLQDMMFDDANTRPTPGGLAKTVMLTPAAFEKGLKVLDDLRKEAPFEPTFPITTEAIEQKLRTEMKETVQARQETAFLHAYDDVYIAVEMASRKALARKGADNEGVALESQERKASQRMLAAAILLDTSGGQRPVWEEELMQHATGGEAVMPVKDALERLNGVLVSLNIGHSVRREINRAQQEIIERMTGKETPRLV